MLEISVHTLTCYPLDYVVCQIQNKSNQNPSHTLARFFLLNGVLSPQLLLPGSAAWKALGLGNGYG